MKRSLAGDAPVASRGARARTVNALLDLYLTAYAADQAIPRRATRYIRDVAVIRPWFGDELVDALTKLRITEILARMRATGLGNGSLATYLARLKACLRWARGDGRRGADPPLIIRIPAFPTMKPGAIRQHVMTLDEALRLRAALPQPYADLLILIFFTGLRRAEACRLTWPQVDLERRELLLDVGDTKTDAQYHPAIPEALHEVLLARRRAAIGSTLVFTLPNGRPVDPDTFGDAWKRAARRLGIVARPHDCRRTHYDRQLEHGVSLPDAMAAIGHKRIATALRYTVVQRQRLQENAKRLDASPRGRAERRLVAVQGGKAS